MYRSACVVLAMLLGCLPCLTGAAEEVPPLKDLRKPVEVAQTKEDEEPVLPSAVSPDRMVRDPAQLCPDGAIWYLTVPDAGRMVGHWEESPTGKLVSEPAMVRTFQNNRFGMSFLFSDLPDSVITPERVASIASILELSNSLAKMAQKIAMAGYIDEDGKFNFLFLFDIGTDRLPAFQRMGEWETFFFIAHPGSDVTRGNHAGNYLDVWTVKDSMQDRRSGQIAAGFAENMAIVSNNPSLAFASLELLAGGPNVAESSWGKRLAASLSSSSSADAIAFLRMDELLKGLKETPIARNSVVAWANYVGHGGQGGEALYYGLEFTADGSRETFLLPSSGPEAPASLIEVLAKRLRPVDKWTTTSIIPYQPNPSMFFAANLEGRQLGGILRQERRLFGEEGSSDAYSFSIPRSVRNIFDNEIISLLTGEIGVAFFPLIEERASWIMVLPCTRSPEKLLGKAPSMKERSGATIFSNEGNWQSNLSWTVISSDRFRRVSGHYLVVSSDGDHVVSVIDQLMGGSSFANNRDFAKVSAQSEEGQGLLFYINTPEVLVRQYPNLSAIMRTLYPRSSGLNSRPPLAVLRRYARGVLGTITPAANGEEFTRVTVQAPLPTLAALTTGIVLTFPRSLRQDGRLAMEASRNNLRDVWMRLQLYASRYGHFPDSLEDMVAEMRGPGVSNEALRAMLVAPAVLSRLGLEEAANQSYRYLSGVTPNDEPDIPVVYEAQAWSEDFLGQYPANLTRGRSESGDFVPFRQYVRLDGRIVTVSEKRFIEKVLPRILERE